MNPRNYVRAGVPQRVALELLGHQTASIFARYNIVSDEDLREAVKKQTQYLKSQGKEKPAYSTRRSEALGVSRYSNP
jgi:hypothetical protein